MDVRDEPTPLMREGGHNNNGTSLMQRQRLKPQMSYDMHALLFQHLYSRKHGILLYPIAP